MISNEQRSPSEASPTRMQALSRLPVFFALAGKRVVVAGGNAAAAWKVELLAAAGAVTLIPGALVIWFVRNHIAKGFALGRV